MRQRLPPRVTMHWSSTQDGTGSDNQDIQARFFDGTSFAAEVTIADTPGTLFRPDVAALTDGRFIIVFTTMTMKNVEGRFVSAGGVPLGSVFTISDLSGDDLTGLGSLRCPTVDSLSLGARTIPDIAPELDVNEAVLAQRFDADGLPAGDVFLVNTGDPDTDQDRPAVGVNAAGQAFIVWQDSNTFPGADTEPDGIRGHAFLATTDIVNGTGARTSSRHSA